MSCPEPTAAEAFPLNELANDPELMTDFVAEAREHLLAVERHLLALDQGSQSDEALQAIFRGFHTIKGLAGFLGLAAIQEVAHEVETVLDLARNRQLAMTPAHIDVILATKDHLSVWINEIEDAVGGKTPTCPDHRQLLESIHQLGAATLLDPVVEALSELSRTAEAQELPSSSEAPSIKVDTRKLDFLVDMVGELVIAQSLVEHDPDLDLTAKPRLTRNLAQLARITGEVQRTAMSMRMIPMRPLFQKMSRLVRDLSRKTGKPAELDLIGEDTELDRNIVERLADPIMHMLRNSVDHGIETPEERELAGKARTARVLLKAAHQAGHIVVEISDDGRGLNTQKILTRAHERGLVADGAHLAEGEAFNLIFAPGFSTAERVTSVSGRGVGLDVVKKQIHKLRGKIEIQSTAGKGTTIRLKVPLTLAIIDGLLVGVGKEVYVVPLFAVREMLRPAAETLYSVAQRDEMIQVRGSLLPVVRLYRKFGVAPATTNLSESLLIVTEARGKPFCLAVDELIGKQEVVIKSLGESLRGTPGIAGGAILGDGRVGLILDIEGIFGMVEQ